MSQVRSRNMPRLRAEAAATPEGPARRPSLPLGRLANARLCGLGVALVLAALLHGCQTAGPPPEVLPVEPRPEPAPLSRTEQAAIEGLLAAAEQAIRENRLMTPEQGSAYSLYQQVLALAPGSEDAKRGFEKIVERYVRLALNAAEQQSYARARSMLARARLVDPAHPAIRPTEQQVALLEGARRQKVRLDGGHLQRRTEAVQQRLLRLGGQASQPGCRVVINARSDAEGRWVYQQLNRGAGGVRVRATLTVAAPPTVELICFSQAG